MSGQRGARHVSIRGRVQGVGYRAHIEQEALRRGIEGWVRNRTDGSVEAVFVGPPSVVTEMIEACRGGPRFARVDAIDQRDGTDADVERRRAGEVFSVLPTV